jgi:hypothetical protein
LLIDIKPDILKARVHIAAKGRIPYYTFISKEAVEALLCYFNKRKRYYGDIGEDEPVFIPEAKSGRTEQKRERYITEVKVERVVQQAAYNCGRIKNWHLVHPHCLRKAFETALRDNGLDPKDQEFLMGHILPGSQDTYYDKTKISELREKYAKIVFFPQKRFQAEELRKKQIIDTAKLLGYPEDRIKRIEEALAKYKTVDEAMNEIRKLSLESYKHSNSDPKKVIKEDELEHYLAEGWDVHKVLPSGRILIRRTS